MEEVTGCGYLGDDELLAATKRIAARERAESEYLLRHLSEIDRRKLHERESYKSLFYYCLRELKLSEADAWRRSVAAQVARRYPIIYDLLREGEINLTAVAMLAPHLNAANYRTLLRKGAGLSTREVERLVADLQGKPERRDRVRQLAAVASQAAAAATLPFLAATAAPSPIPESLATTADQKVDAVPTVARACPRRVEIKFTADEELWRMLERIRELLRFRVEGDRLEFVIRALAVEWLARHDLARRLGSRTGAKPAAGARQTRRTRRVPQAVKKAVYHRDEGRCSFVSSSGKRCEESVRLEFDHMLPFALGGASDDPANVRLLCRAHNQRAAREVFGDRARR